MLPVFRSPVVTEVRPTPAPARLLPTGLLGWVSFVLDPGIQLECVAVRRTQTGRLTLSYPAKDDGWGKRWTFVRPIDNATRREIERQVLAQLGDLAT